MTPCLKCGKNLAVRTDSVTVRRHSHRRNRSQNWASLRVHDNSKWVLLVR